MKKTHIMFLVVLVVIGMILSGAIISAKMSEEKKEAIKKAIEEKDYDTWEGLMQEDINEEHFNTLVERNEKRKAVRDALDSCDYDGWLEAVLNMERQPPFVDKITEENFPTFCELHQAKKQVRKLSEELGFGLEGKHGRCGRHFGKNNEKPKQLNE